MTRQLKIADGRFSIILPGTWASIPLDDDEEMLRQVKALVLRQVGRNDRFARTRREARDQLVGTARDARANGAITLALSLEILPGVPFPASLIVVEERWPAGSESIPATRDRLAAAFPQAELLDFVAGPVARTSDFRDVKITESTTSNVAAQYWLPVDDGDRLFAVTVDAPMAQSHELYLELFDAIIDSMLWIPSTADEELRGEADG